jgi:hypothetical protein
MSARSIVPGSVGVATDAFEHTQATDGVVDFTDVDGDGVEDARFAFMADPSQEAMAAGNVRYAFWEAEGQVYIATISQVTGVEDGVALQFSARPSTNPARGRAFIRYALPRGGNVRLGIYDTMGRQVTRLVDGWRPAGWHTAPFEGGRSSQLYLYRLDWEGKTLSGKFAVVR